MNRRFYRFLSTFLLFLMLCPLIITSAWADSGPKPSVTVQIKGLENTSYAVTLLSETPGTGPWQKTDRYEASYDHSSTDKAIWTALNDYVDPDGFYFIGCVQMLGGQSEDSNTFRWIYYAPETFKLLIYLPETGEFITDNVVYQRYAFHSYFTASVQGNAIVSVSRDWSIPFEMSGFLFRLAVTLAAELLLALCFGFRSRRALLVVTAANVVTQFLLNLGLNLVSLFYGFWIYLLLFYLLAELVIILAEGLLYLRLLTPREPRRTHPMVYSFTANTCSFVLGLALSMKFSLLF